MQETISVLEVRKAQNGWVVTVLERDRSFASDGLTTPYRAYVAETAERVAEIVTSTLTAESWMESVNLPPARWDKSR